MSSGPAAPVLPLNFAASFPLFTPDLIGERNTSRSRTKGGRKRLPEVMWCARGRWVSCAAA
jgi:hypothetical protein